MRFALLCVLAAMLTASPARAQYPAPADSVAATLDPASDDEANQASDPDRVPYETETNLGAHVLALPATVWGGVAYLFRSLVLYAEYSGNIERAERLLQNRPPVYALPTLSVGGREGLAGGLTVFATEGLLGGQRSGRIGGFYAADGSYAASGRFNDGGLFGSPLRLLVSGGYERDAEERFFALGNDSDDDELIDYAFEQGLAGMGFELPVGAHVRLGADGEFKHYEVTSFDEEGGTPFPADSVAGFGGADFLSAGATFVLDFSRAGGLYAPRTVGGTELILGVRYGTDVSAAPAGGPLGYLRTSAEVRQFVPVPFLAPERRLALRARLVRVNAPGGDTVPFYELATLGGPDDLRGFRFDRFRDQGSLLVTAEYRWPIFNTFDAVLFTDAGQVFDDFEEIGLEEFHFDFGGGFRVFGAGGVAARVELAFSPEGPPRLIAQVGTSF
ncbi:MAG: BamA/TamA family outer membrane protein [Bacteroidota bacterium]